MSGFKRLTERGIIDKQVSKGLGKAIIQGRRALSRPIPSETVVLIFVLEALEAISAELCDLLKDRDRREGADDNPQEIPNEGP